MHPSSRQKLSCLTSQSHSRCCSWLIAMLSKNVSKKKSCNVCRAILATGREYCQVCSPHGFSYWVSSKRTGDKLFWVMVVKICFLGSSYFVKTAITDWIENPTVTTIDTGNNPVTNLDHPALTICKANGIYDVGEYLRAVFNNFQFACESSLESESCKATKTLRRHYSSYLEVVEDIDTRLVGAFSFFVILFENIVLFAFNSRLVSLGSSINFGSLAKTIISK